jgi:hypothetical protein
VTPAELKANVDRFNAAAQEAEDALAKVKAYLETHDAIPDLVDPLTAYIVAVDLMLSASADLAFTGVKLTAKPQ